MMLIHLLIDHVFLVYYALEAVLLLWGAENLGGNQSPSDCVCILPFLSPHEFR